MTDRELVELAAKAIGLPILRWLNDVDATAVIDNRTYAIWGPLYDDGDALRLAVDLRITLNFTECACCVSTYANQLDEDGPDFCIRHSKKYDDCETTDPFVATRIAIVRTAAEIGRRLNE